MALGLRVSPPMRRQASVYPLVITAFIGLPCPKKIAGISSGMRVILPNLHGVGVTSHRFVSTTVSPCVGPSHNAIFRVPFVLSELPKGTAVPAPLVFQTRLARLVYPEVVQ